MASRNRSAGHNYEKDIARILRDIGFQYTVTSRSENRSRDGQKVDLCNKDELVNGRLPYNVQCKSAAKSLKYIELLAEMPDCSANTNINVVLHRKTAKSKGGKFMVKGEYAILSQKDFLFLVELVEVLTRNNPKRS